MMVSGSNTVRAYMTPTSSKRACVGSKPDSSASTPKTSEPPFLGVALEYAVTARAVGRGTGDAVEPQAERARPGHARHGRGPAQQH